MTPAEHDLIIAFFARQVQLIKTVMQILKNKEVITDDDFQAFEFVVTQDDSSNTRLLASTKAEYLSLAKALGVETGLKTS